MNLAYTAILLMKQSFASTNSSRRALHLQVGLQITHMLAGLVDKHRLLLAHDYFNTLPGWYVLAGDRGHTAS